VLGEVGDSAETTKPTGEEELVPPPTHNTTHRSEQPVQIRGHCAHFHSVISALPETNAARRSDAGDLSPRVHSSANGEPSSLPTDRMQFRSLHFPFRACAAAWFFFLGFRAGSVRRARGRVGLGEPHWEILPMVAAAIAIRRCDAGRCRLQCCIRRRHEEGVSGWEILDL
jgi:hypothetical protein